MSSRTLTAVRPDGVRRDLLYLRKGVGYSDTRLLGCSALCAALGGDDQRDGAGSGVDSEPVGVLRERLESAIDSLHDADAELLRAVLGFGADDSNVEARVGSNASSLGQRRDAIGQRLGIGREAVADRDSQAVERLLDQLLSGWYPKSPIPLRIPESHNGLVNLAVHLSTVVRDRKHVLTRHRYRFYVTFDGAEYIAIAMTEPVVPEVTAGSFVVKTKPAERGALHQFWHEEPLRRGQIYDLGIVVRNPDPVSDPYWLTEESLAFHEPTRVATFDVTFEGTIPEAVPDVVWGFRGLTANERPGAPGQGQVLTPDKGGRVRVEFRDLYGGLFAGVGWK